MLVSSGAALSTEESILVDSNDTLIAQADALIEQRYDTIMEQVAESLSAQNSLDMLDVYEAIIKPMVRYDVYAELGITRREPEVGFYAPNGGVVSYNLPRESGVAPAPTVVICYTAEQAAEIIEGLNQTQASLSFWNGVIDCLGDQTVFEALILADLDLPSIAVSGLLSMIMFLNDLQLESIHDADDYVMVTLTYHVLDNSWTKEIIGWWTHPTIFMPDGMTIYDATFEPFT